MSINQEDKVRHCRRIKLLIALAAGALALLAALSLYLMICWSWIGICAMERLRCWRP